MFWCECVKSPQNRGHGFEQERLLFREDRAQVQNETILLYTIYRGMYETLGRSQAELLHGLKRIASERRGA